MHFSEHSKRIDKKPIIKSVVISHLPMFDNPNRFSGKSFYKTTYNDEFLAKKRLLEYPVERDPDFSINNKYDFQELSNRLTDKNNNSNISNSSNINNRQFFNDSNYYKRPSIPDYIRRDHFFQSNNEKNIEYIHTENNIVIPVVKSNGKKNGLRNEEYGNFSDNFESRSSDQFYMVSKPKQALIQRQSEAQSAYTPKANEMMSNIPAHLRKDRFYQTTGEKNVSNIMDNNGRIITYIPNYDQDSDRLLFENAVRNYNQ